MKILLLSTWFPYPPDQGSKIRAYHILKALASRHEVSLISFKDGDLRSESIEHIQEFCTQVRVVDREPFSQSMLGRFFGWFSPKPRAIVGSYSSRMGKEVQKQVRMWKPDVIVALTFIAAMYAQKSDSIFRIADVDNLLSLMLYEEFQAEKNIPQRIRRYLAYLKFLRFERDLYQSFDLNLVTSDLDSKRIRDYISLTESQVLAVRNGVDLRHYRPNLHRVQPGKMVFNGALSYEPNYDAMKFFLSDIYPMIKQGVPQASLWITGSTTDVDLRPLSDAQDVTFTGYVEDIREVVAGSTACVVPLRKGAGTRLKILEAMALGVPVITTSKGAEGLDMQPGEQIMIADAAEDFASATIQVLTDQSLRRRLISNGLASIREQFGWEKIGAEFVNAMESKVGDRLHVA